MDSSNFDKDVCLGYESCIRVNGRPILPPLMSEARRHEMRQYREQAMQRENLRRSRPAHAQLVPRNPVHLLKSRSPLFRERCSAGLLFNEPAAPQVIDEPLPPQVIPPQIREPSPPPATAIDGPKTESECHPSPPRGVRFFDDNLSGSPNVTIRPHRRRTRAPLFDDGLIDDSVSVAHSNASDSWSTSTFVIETSQSHSATAPANTSFLSEGEVVEDDSDDEDDLDEAANLHVRRGGYSTPDQVDTAGYSTPTQDCDIEPRQASMITISKDDNDNTVSARSFNELTSVSLSNAIRDDISTVSAAFTTATSVTDSSVFDSISNIGLSKLKSKMQTMSPSLFKIAGYPRSPLLKGVVFMDPLNRPHSVKKIPPEALDPSMKPKFDRVTACVKGYLVRRLLKTEKVNNLLQTIHDTVELILNLYEEGGAEQGSRGLSLRAGDMGLHARLIQQLNGATGAIHDIFFKLSTPERMAIISTDRIKMRSKALRDGAAASKASSGKKNISIATLRCMERRKTIAMHPGRKRAQYQPDKLPLHVPSHIIPTPMSSSVTLGSQSAKSKPKPTKTFVVSPKRRRMTTFGKTSTPPYVSSTRGGTLLARLAQLDKSKSSSNPNMSKSRNGMAPPSRTEGRTRKKMDATFVKPSKGATRPLIPSNR